MATEQSVMAVIRSARPSFRTRYDKVSFAVNAAFAAAGYVLHATGPSAFAEDALSSASTDEVGIDNWNDVEDNYAFVYSNPEKNVLKEGGSKPLHLEVDVGEYVEENGGTNYGSQFKNLGKLVTSVNKDILDKLDGASASSSLSQHSSSERMSREDRRPENNFLHIHGFVVPPLPGYGGSMSVGPTDPRFFGGPFFFGGGDLSGVPPGARYTPYGPVPVPGSELGRFVGGRERPRGGLRPDSQHFHDGSDFI
ncbi:hypothetical protein CASFOL_017397 [Castilleja foliolosa]|uniref:PI31 proteasome regulator N-terminal domain-containing protein n=1 Tax=Castilleja foliolosa TaxID=1961234 RepID=A0ABD3DF81_9LAMI